MTDVNIRNRYNNAVLFTAEVDCDRYTDRSMQRGQAVRLAVENGHHLQEADLSGINLPDANLSNADLRHADFRDADLCGANLIHCDMRGANLSYAVLTNADMRETALRGANLDGTFLRNTKLGGSDLIDCGARSDGYQFYALEREDELWIKAGCHWFTAKDAIKHWKETRGGEPLGDESLQLIKNAKALHRIRNKA